MFNFTSSKKQTGAHSVCLFFLKLECIGASYVYQANPYQQNRLEGARQAAQYICEDQSVVCCWSQLLADLQAVGDQASACEECGSDTCQEPQVVSNQECNHLERGGCFTHQEIMMNNARELNLLIKNLLMKVGDVQIVNDISTVDDVVEHAVDIDLVVDGWIYNIHINTTRFGEVE